jgi:phospholipase C
VSVSLQKIKTIVVVMLENRSFDHMLGYLSLPEFRGGQVEGFRDNATGYDRGANLYKRETFMPWLSDDPFSRLPGDPPHERENISLQLGPRVDGKNPMSGFVENYKIHVVDTNDRPPVMSYFGPSQVPIAHFLADNFAICDQWFSSLPAGTQPNRLMAMSGYSVIDNNTHLLPKQFLVYDWLNLHNIRWRVYHEGMPFFAMMPNWVSEIFNREHFRGFEHLMPDIMEARPGREMPSVLFLEPGYTDAPHVGRSSDDHAPSGAAAGQEFLMKVYNAISRDPDLWNGSVMVITYDEHGGFFDHFSPVDLVTLPPLTATYEPFQTSGVRVPTFIVSPFVKPRDVYHQVFDHTSILKFLGERFGINGAYGLGVDQRPVHSISEVLDVDLPPRDIPPAPNLVEWVKQAPVETGRTLNTSPTTPIERSFQTALDTLHAHSVDGTEDKFPDLVPFITRT